MQLTATGDKVCDRPNSACDHSLCIKQRCTCIQSSVVTLNRKPIRI